MKKLSKTQLECIERMKATIDKARAYDDFKAYMLATNNFLARQQNPSKEFDENKEYYEQFRQYWEKYREGKVLVANYGKPTLNALAKLGIVTIIEYEANRKSIVMDWVKLNNY